MTDHDMDMLDDFFRTIDRDDTLLDSDDEQHTLEREEEVEELLQLSSSPMSISAGCVNHASTASNDVNGDSTYHFRDADFDVLPHTSPEQISLPSMRSTVSHLRAIGVDAQQHVMTQLEAVFESIADALLAERNHLRINLAMSRRGHSRTSDTVGRPSRTRSLTVTFPGKTAEEAWRFTVVLRLLELIHEVIRSGGVSTKRDIFYRDPALFGKQSVVDRYVDQIALTLEVPRSALNITAAAKGLMTGSVVFCHKDGSQLDLMASTEGVLIHGLGDILSVDMGAARWVMVVEKEATFHTIIKSDEWQRLKWKTIMVTGKGYPDLATRAMVRFLSRASMHNGFANVPVYGLMDYDPDGLAIFMTYKQGSRMHRIGASDLTVPNMQWLGLCSRHIKDGDDTHGNQGLMPLTKRDRHKARKMLEKKEFCGEEDSVPVWRGQLQVMLYLNLKAELQILDTCPGALTNTITCAVE
ncbi:hypothetical protein AAFC00_000600 [Neodothiora populina]|uniref:DNA topoisomerase (ATP-hydrolyzing) n=1 Tax=Neodothiora populina TaxID=2781224 RepID=A0ABR3PDK9_9PEZI